MDNTTFNGWTNKETWLVNLWLGDTLAEMWDEGTDITPDLIESLVNDWLGFAQGNDVESGFLVDMLNCALGSVNYHELAKHYEGN